jgi:putative glutathione S-transferase
MLINGQWTQRWHPFQAKDRAGRFVRQESSFRRWVGENPELPAVPGRYRLYVTYICPWASRVLMVRALKGLEDIIPVTVLEPWLSDEGWRFGTGLNASGSDPELDAQYLHELYSTADATFSGRATVPVLWDREQRSIVNNESAELVRMLGTVFDRVGGNPAVQLYPTGLRDEIDSLNDRMYRRLNNGVYRAGFASTQGAYEEAVEQVFAELDDLEERLSDGRPYLHGERLTESDVRAFVSLVRFDLAYYGLFKCNLRPLRSYRALSAFVDRVENIPGVADTVHRDHIKHGYYSIRALNPTGIVPVGPT